MSNVSLVAGKGIEGDRYMTGGGFYSHLRNEGEQITLFELETLIALERDAAIELGPEEHRQPTASTSTGHRSSIMTAR
jgi:hypothetical protein